MLSEENGTRGENGGAVSEWAVERSRFQRSWKQIQNLSDLEHQIKSESEKSMQQEKLEDNLGVVERGQASCRRGEADLDRPSSTNGHRLNSNHKLSSRELCWFFF